MQRNAKELEELELQKYIDLYLNGLLSEKAMDEFEAKWFEDKNFFHKVQARERLREKVAQIIEKDGEEIFSNYLAKERIQKEKGKAENLFKQIFRLWQNLKPAWKYSIIPASVAAILMVIFFLQSNDPFQLNSELEKELGTRLLRAEPLEIISPRIGENIDGFIQFSWQIETDGPFEVIIINNMNVEVSIFKTIEKSYSYEGSLPAGLYYWKFLEDGDWLYTGKFLIKKE